MTIPNTRTIPLDEAARLLGQSQSETEQYAKQHKLRRLTKRRKGREKVSFYRDEVLEHVRLLSLKAETKQPRTTDAGSRSRQAILSILKEEPLRQAEILKLVKDACGVNKTTAKRTIKQMTEGGELRRLEVVGRTALAEVYIVRADSPITTPPTVAAKKEGMITTTQAAAILGVSNSWFTNVAKRHKLHSVERRGREEGLYKKSEVEALKRKFAATDAGQKTRRTHLPEVGPELISMEDAATILGVTLGSFYAIRKAEKLQTQRPPKSALLYCLRKEVEALAARRNSGHVPAPELDYINTKEAGAILGVKETWVIKLTSRNGLSCVIEKKRRQRLYLRSEIEALKLKRANLDNFINTVDAAALFGVKPGTFRKLAAENNIKAVAPPGPKMPYLYPKGEVEALLAQLKAKRTQPADHVSADEAAALYGVSKTSFQRLARLNQLATKPGANYKIKTYRRCDVVALVELRQLAAEQPPATAQTVVQTTAQTPARAAISAPGQHAVKAAATEPEKTTTGAAAATATKTAAAAAMTPVAGPTGLSKAGDMGPDLSEGLLGALRVTTNQGRPDETAFVEEAAVRECLAEAGITVRNLFDRTVALGDVVKQLTSELAIKTLHAADLLAANALLQKENAELLAAAKSAQPATTPLAVAKVVSVTAEKNGTGKVYTSIKLEDDLFAELKHGDRVALILNQG